MKKTIVPINDDKIISRIYTIREQKVMLDLDLAELYEVETKVLNQTVKRNIERFQNDFMFQLTEKKFENLRSQIVTSNRGGRRYLPFAFTDYGILMLSSVLRSERAIQVNIQIMRTFIRLKKQLSSNELTQQRLEKIEKKIVIHDISFERVFEAIELMLDQPRKRIKDIGFIKPVKQG